MFILALFLTGTIWVAGRATADDGRIALMPVAGKMMVNAVVPRLDRQVFGLGVPETIGSQEQMWLVNHADAVIAWEEDDGRVSTTWEAEGQIRYRLELIPATDYVDLVMTIENLSPAPWHGVFAFNCVSPAKAPAFADSAQARTYMAVGDGAVPLREVPRVLGPRPTVSVFAVRAAAPTGAGRDTSQVAAAPLPPFARAFAATSPQAAGASWLAVVAEDGDGYMATTAADASFLFTNTKFGCIHAAPSFGDIAPGAAVTVRSRVYFARGDLDDFLVRVGVK